MFSENKLKNTCALSKSNVYLYHHKRGIQPRTKSENMKNLAFHIEKVQERFVSTFYYVGGHNDRVIKVEKKSYKSEEDARGASQYKTSLELTEKPTVIHADHSEEPISL